MLDLFTDKRVSEHRSIHGPLASSFSSMERQRQRQSTGRWDTGSPKKNQASSVDASQQYRRSVAHLSDEFCRALAVDLGRTMPYLPRRAGVS